MSGAPEPLKLTLEEAMHEHRRRRLAEPYLGDVWFDHEGKWRRKAIAGPGTIHDSWAQAFSEAWGVPVVARDEAAELRAQVSRLQEALAFAQSVIRSGERWSPSCAEVIGGALAATGGRGDS